jgi:hypothetical protein
VKTLDGTEARGREFGWDVTFEARRSRVRFPISILYFVFNCPKSYSRTITQGSTRSLKELSTRKVAGEGSAAVA